MARQSFHIDGLSELEDALAELPKATGKNVLKRALTKAGEPIEEMAERLAPQLSGALKRSFTTGTKLSRRQKSQHEKESDVEVFVGPGSLAQAITQEFGTAHHGAKPFMRPAWDSNKSKAFDTIKEDIKTEIDKAVARLARKAARLAAKMKATG